MKINPKICIAFNAGAAGDFLAYLVGQQCMRLGDPVITDDGMMLNPPGHEFKGACKRYYSENFENMTFDLVDNHAVVNTHQCSQEIINSFPNCKFYYIDDRGHTQKTVDAFVKKRITYLDLTLNEFTRQIDRFKHLPLDKEIPEDAIKNVLSRDWERSIEQWESLGMVPIPLAEIVVKEKCWKIVRNMIEYGVDYELFSRTYDEWANKNSTFIKNITNE